MNENATRWFTWDKRIDPTFSDFLLRMRERGWWYLGDVEPVLTASGVDCQFVWDDDRGDPPSY